MLLGKDLWRCKKSVEKPAWPSHRKYQVMFTSSETTKNDMGSKVLQEVQHHVFTSNSDYLAHNFPTETAATCTSGKEVELTALSHEPTWSPRNCLTTNNSNNNTPLDSEVLLNGNLPLLPPCRICGEKASGFHYGANTCEACKGFFRRSLRKKEKYKCVGRGRCEIRSSKRSLCGACRYRKCLAVGMSKEAIKTGRYTHEKKTRDIEEVKRIVQHRLRAQAVMTMTVSSDTGASTLVTSVRPMKVVSVEEIEEIVKRITDAHLIHTRYILEKLPEKEREYLEQRALQEKYFGTLKPLPIEEYMKIYEITGIDIDGRRDLIEGFIPYVESCIRRFIAFAKAVPGFKELLTEDQIAIIKASRFEAWMILCHRHFNHELHLYTTVYGKVICYEEMIKLHNADYIDLMFLAQERIRSLDLNYEETCILGAFTMMFTDRCRLQNPLSVEDIQDLLLTCLSYWFKKSRPDEPMIFAKIIDVLVQLRMVRHLHSKEEEKFAMRWSNKIQLPPLMYEMWSS